MALCILKLNKQLAAQWKKKDLSSNLHIDTTINQ